MADLGQRSRALAEQERLVAARLAAAEQQKREMLEKSLHEAQGVIQDAKRQVGAILDEARREKSRLAKERIRQAEEQVEMKLRELHPETQLSLEKIAVGDTVLVRSIGYDGTVVALDRKQGRLRVRAGLMEMDVSISDLAPRSGKAAAARKAPRPSGTQEAANQLNLVGARVDDALPELERFLNRASLDGLGELRVIHGKGTGALMRAVREYLDGHPLIREYRRGEPFEGGDGVTVVTLR